MGTLPGLPSMLQRKKAIAHAIYPATSGQQLLPRRGYVLRI
jgi:hypothetical protein